MRGVSIVAGCVGLAMLVSGCAATLEERLIQDGIGTELPVEDMAETTRRLNLYLSFLCEQAGMAKSVSDGVDVSTACDMKPYGNAGWSLLVKAGFNDIDRRCDSYLAWLNSRRRNRSAILGQISDTRTFTEALMFTTGAGAMPMAIAGLAFGLASNTFTNYYSRLLFEIEKSTVQVLVHEKRLQYRERLNMAIAFQPDAVHVLREYLLICTPFYIEDLINQRTRDSVAGNTPADKGTADQIRRSMVAGALIRSIPETPRAPLPSVGKDKENRPQRDDDPPMAGGSTDSEKTMPKSVGQSIQANLCVTPTGTFDPATRNAIQEAKVGEKQSGPSASIFNNTRNQIANAAETQIFLGRKPCGFDMSGTDRMYQTAFEKFTFPGEGGIKSLQAVLIACDPTLKGKESGKFDPPTRAAIKVAKSKFNAAQKAGLADLDTETLSASSYNTITLVCR